MGNLGTGTTLADLELSWYASRSSLPSQANPGAVIYSLSHHKSAYFSRGSLPSANLKPVISLEKEWLALITGVAESQGLQALWAAAVAGNTLGTAETGIVANKILFYSGSSVD